MEDKFIGFILAVVSSLFIGVSFIITKKALISSDGHGSGESYAYLSSATWWFGMGTMVIGEIANFAAYSFAPAILVTPLGALSVFISSVLASVLLKERLGVVGKIGCVLCILGSVVIVIHAPEEKVITSVNEIIEAAAQPCIRIVSMIDVLVFMIYFVAVTVFTLYMIFKVAPTLGKRNLLVYISICSLVGSISVMSCKGLGIALKLTFAGNNQFGYFSTYFLAFIVAVSVLTQMNYLNKALDLFSTAVVTPVYYVFFTTATIVASVILFQGLDDSTPVQVISLFSGFCTIFLGVYLLSYEKTSSPVHEARHASLPSASVLPETTSMFTNYNEEELGLTTLHERD